MDYGREGITGRCPGEEKCSFLRDAAGGSWQEKVEEAMAGCKKCTLPPLTGDETAPESGIDRAANRIFHLRQRRKSGFPLSEAKITALEYQALLFLDERIDLYERAAGREQTELLKMFLTVKQSM